MTDMTNVAEAYAARVSAGEALSPDELRSLADGADILSLGMLADTARRARHGRQVTFVRVAEWRGDSGEAVPPAAGEVEIGGAPTSIGDALDVVARCAVASGGRVVSAFSWADVARWAGHDAASARRDVLAQLRGAGLGAIASLPIDEPGVLDEAVAALTAAGFERLRLTVDRASAADRTALFFRVAELQRQHGSVEALDPLPKVLHALRPTTGYEDVKMVAVARLAVPGVPHIQVDWRRYGPKLAQVALTFGADDVYGIAASDDAPEGRRRAPLEEIRRNIEAAGFEPRQRDGRFVVAS